jgi:hypothetical protein
LIDILISCFYTEEFPAVLLARSTENTLYIRKSNFYGYSCIVFISTFSYTKFPFILQRFVFPDRQYRVRLLHRPQADALFVSKRDQPPSSSSPHAKEGRDELKNLIWPLLIIFPVTILRFVEIPLFTFPIKQFCLPVTTTYNFDKNCNSQRALAKFLELQQPEVRISPEGRARIFRSCSILILEFTAW